jgi:hypothetical protein
MQIPGQWTRCDDGVTRPTLRAKIRTGEGGALPILFLVDLGADRTALSSEILNRLKLQTDSPPPGIQFEGVAGSCDFVVVRTALELKRDDGVVAVIHGPFSVLTDPNAVMMSILGRDVLDNFDVIVSRPRNEVLLLSQRHTYQVIEV